MRGLALGVSRSIRMLGATALAAALAVPALAQEAAAPKPAAGATRSGYRKLAPGVEQTIKYDFSAGDTFSNHPIVELKSLKPLDWKPPYAPKTETLRHMSENVTFRHTVRGLDISFKPLRMMYVDIPQPSGKFQRKLIWYLVYRVTNRGGHLVPEKKENGVYDLQPSDGEEVFFHPQFILQSHEFKKEYLDRVIPVAMAAIRQREDPKRNFLNSVQMGAKPIPLSDAQVDRSVWGIATWEDVDPNIDFLSIYVGGLTDAYRWTDAPGPYEDSERIGIGRRFERKYLKLNFWRAGDDKDQHEDELHFGLPPGKDSIYGMPKDAPPGLDFVWVYR